MMTTKEAIKFAEYAQIMSDGKPDVQEFYKIAEAALREQEQEDPKPLTLDELRQMDGEPVWVKADHCGVYADIVHIQGQEDGESYVHFKINWRLQENGYGKTWLAYRHKPREEV